MILEFIPSWQMINYAKERRPITPSSGCFSYFLLFFPPEDAGKICFSVVWGPTCFNPARVNSKSLSLLELIMVLHCNILLLGDVNIHLDAADLSETVGFKTILECFGLSQMSAMDEPTHRAGHTLDVVVVNKKQLNAVITRVHPPGAISDHSLILTSYPFKIPQPSVCNATARAWKKFDRGRFLKDLTSSQLCSSVENLQDKSVDELADFYSLTLHSLIEHHALCVNLRKHYRPITPWFNAACRAHKRKARCLERVYRRTRNDVDRTHWLDQLKCNSEFY